MDGTGAAKAARSYASADQPGDCNIRVMTTCRLLSARADRSGQRSVHTLPPPGAGTHPETGLGCGDMQNAYVCCSF